MNCNSVVYYSYTKRCPGAGLDINIYTSFDRRCRDLTNEGIQSEGQTLYEV